MTKDRRIAIEKLPQNHFVPRYLNDAGTALEPFTGPHIEKPVVYIQSAISGNLNPQVFARAKLRQLVQLSELAPDIFGIHSFAGPDAPGQIMNEKAEKESVPFILTNIRKAFLDGWTGVVINDCMADPGLEEGRRMLQELGATGKMEMVAPAETSLKMTANKFGLFAIVGIADANAIFERLARSYGVSNRLVDIVLEEGLVPSALHDLTEVAESLFGKIVTAQKKGANAVVFGCTTLGGVGDELMRLHEKELRGYPLIEPIPVTLLTAVGKVREMSNLNQLK